MEAEFGIILNRNLEPNQINHEYLLVLISIIHPIIEIHNKVFYGKEPYGAEHISNNAINAGVVRVTGVSKPNINEITDLKLILR